MPFADRFDAGRRLARLLEDLRGVDVVVVGLPRGGVAVAFEIARALDVPLDVIVVRKLGVPFQPELGMGAIGEGGVKTVNEEVVRMAGVSSEDLADAEAHERSVLERRVRRFRGGLTPIRLMGRTVVVVDDGIATGSTARAACEVARARGATRVVLAVPVAPPDSLAALCRVADEVVCIESPSWFFAIGQFYDDFTQTSDEQVVELLQRASQGFHEPAAPAPAPVMAGDRADPLLRDDEVEVPAGDVWLPGHLTVPEEPRGMVIFAHGSGSSRHSPRNRYVASVLKGDNLGTLLFDLLTAHEELDRSNVFDIGLLGRRLVDVTHWLRSDPLAASLPFGYFGASTGAAAALWAAAESGSDAAAVVSRGGRPDLAAERIPLVTAPTLLIVGGDDDVVLRLNQQAEARLRCQKRLEVIPGATHLFEEPGALEEVARLAREWFTLAFRPASIAR